MGLSEKELENAAISYTEQRYALLGYDFYFDPKIAVEAFKEGARWTQRELTKDKASSES